MFAMIGSVHWGEYGKCFGPCIRGEALFEVGEPMRSSLVQINGYTKLWGILRKGI